jgi:cell division protein FtsB
MKRGAVKVRADMTRHRARPAFGAILTLCVVLVIDAYFIFAAVQGDYGVFRRVQILAEADVLDTERDRLTLELAGMKNRTHRLSDEYLDLDLLDEQARDVLGYVRADEIVIQ